MINEEKLRLMTKTALLEKNNQKQFKINRYYKKDYISYHLLLVWICVTIAFLLVTGGAALVYIERYPDLAQKQDLRSVLFTLLMIYIIVVFVYVIISMLVYSARYDRAQAVVKRYSNALKLLEKDYEKEECQNVALETIRKADEEKNGKKKNAVKRKGGSKE